MDMTEEEIFEELTAFFDGNKYAAAGLMGNFWIESHIESDRLSGNGQKKVGMTSEEYTEAVDNGTYTDFATDGCGYGLAQLSYSAKKQGLLDMAKETNQSVASTRLQIAHIEQELEDRPELLEQLKNADSAWGAGVRFMMGYEGPADKSDENQDNRGNTAEYYYDMYKHLNGNNASGNLLEDIYMDIDKINEITERLESKIKSINIASIDVASIFLPLTSLGIATSLISSLKVKLKNAEDMVFDTCHNIFNITNEQSETDTEYTNKEIDVNKKTSGGYYRTGGSSYSGGGENIVNNETTVNNSTKDLSINNSLVNTVLMLDENSYTSLMLALYELKGGLLKYLESSEFEGDLKSEILNNPNISDDIKKIVSEMEPSILRTELINMLGNTNMFSDFSKKVIYNYFNYTGNRETLLKNLSLLTNEGLNILDGDVSKNLLDIYDGEKTLNQDAQDFYRLFIELLADEKGITREALLNGTSHKTMLKKSVSDVTKLTSYLKTMEGLGSTAQTKAINSIISGGMYK